MERAQILLKLAGAAWHREGFRSEKEIMTKVPPDLFLMCINPIAPKITVSNSSVIPSNGTKHSVIKGQPCNI